MELSVFLLIFRFIAYTINSMSSVMIDFDVVKWAKVFRKHGLPLQIARIVLEDPSRIIAMDQLHGAGEERWLAFGLCFGAPVCVSFTMRGETYRVITMYRIHEKEWRKRHG
jgi:uncharacterized DUF497 family protein